MTTRRTTCRICESACGMLATVEDGTVLALAPDPEHPISAGFACVKGTRFAARVQNHPARCTTPRWQGAPVPWPEAMASVGARLRPLLERHGPEAVGIYSGNAAGHQLGAVLGITALQRGLRTTKHYSCLTLDNSEQFVVAEAVFGNPLTTFVADYAGADLVVLFGTDPLQSMASQSQSHPRAGDGIRARGRAGELWVVDPRPSVTARAGRHLAIRPGTDGWVLGWLAHHALARGRLGDETTPLRQATAGFTRERVLRVTGLPAAELDDLLEAVTLAERPLVWSGLGVLLGPHGTVGWWLTVVLQAALGGLGKTWRYQPSAVNLPRWFARLGVKGRDRAVRSPVGDWPAIMGTLPAATLARDVLRDDPTRLRALIVVGGDPASALPNTAEAHRALDALDLLVCVDLFENETGRRADALLPAATWLERDQVELHTAHQRPRSYLRWDRAAVPPRGQARSDWEILLGLCEAAGVAPFGSRIAGWAATHGLGPRQIARAVTALSGVPWRAVRGSGHLTSGEAAPPTGRFAVPEWCAHVAELADPEPRLRLITSVRPLAAMNHWLRPGAEAAVARVRSAAECPAGPADLVGPAGTLRVAVEHDAAMSPGTVVLGFGTAHANPNRVIASDRLEPFSGQPISNGTAVRLVPAAPEPE